MHSIEMTIIFIATVFGLFAAMMAYLISYEEYSHHFVDKRRGRHMAYESAVFAFAVFFGIGLILAFLLPRLL